MSHYLFQDLNFSKILDLCSIIRNLISWIFIWVLKSGLITISMVNSECESISLALHAWTPASGNSSSSLKLTLFHIAIHHRLPSILSDWSSRHWLHYSLVWMHYRLMPCTLDTNVCSIEVTNYNYTAQFGDEHFALLTLKLLGYAFVRDLSRYPKLMN